MEWFNLQDNVNLLSLIGALVIIVLTIVIVGKYVNQMKESNETNAELSDHNWDGIGEYKNNLPLGWAVVFVLTLVWGIWYFLWGYPLNEYSQIGEYNQEVAEQNAKFNKEFASMDNKELENMGRSIFLVQCSACHGITGNGMNARAANLHIWGSEEGIYQAIINGSKGLNYPGGEMPKGSDLGIDDASAKAIAAYVAKDISGIKSTKNENLVAQGKELYATCAACHGDDGKGMEGTFPDLTQYGTSAFVVNVLNSGKNGEIGIMPKFSDDRLNKLQQKAVGEYVISLSRGQ